MASSRPAARYTAEFVGTFLLVFTIGCNVLAGSDAWAATSIAAVLMVSIYALAGVSGAHFNPAVSFAIQISGKGGKEFSWRETGIYCAVQILAGCAAGLSSALALGESINVQPVQGFGWWEVMFAEILYTMVLCFVVLNCAAAKKNQPNEYTGFAVGFVIVAGGYAAGAISGGAFNPAVALGLDITSISKGFGWGIAYTAFELVGAAIAAFLFFLVRPDEYSTKDIKDYDLPTKCASEFIGTYVLVLTVGLNVLAESPAAAFSIAAALMCMIFSLGNCSGGHFNPAVTVSLKLSARGQFRGGKAQSGREVGYYVGSQVLAGICAAFTYAGMNHGRTFPLGPKKPYGWVAALIGEFVFTFVLCFVVLCVASVVREGKKTNGDYIGFVIGSCVTAGGFAVGAISGGSLNPAVSIGISTVNVFSYGYFYQCILYTIIELAGAALAAGAFRVTHVTEYTKGLSTGLASETSGANDGEASA